MAIYALLVILIGTYFPLIFTWVPVLGTLKMVLVAGVVLLAVFAGAFQSYRNQTPYRNPLVFCWASFLCLMMLGTFVSYDQGQTLTTFLGCLKVFVVFLAMIKVVDSSEKLTLVVSTFTLSAVGMATITIYNYASGTSMSARGFNRAIALEGGIFGDPNDLALLFNSALPFAVYFVLVKKKKLLPLAGVALLAIGTMLSYSRAGFLGLCLMGLMFPALFGIRMKAILTVLVAVTVLFSVAPASYRERLSSITAWEVDGDTGKTGTRMDSWKAAIPVGLAHPILGVGAGSGTYVNGETVEDWHAIHNAFVQVFVEIGMLGFTAYLALFIIPYRQYRKYFASAPTPAAARLSVLFRVVVISLAAFACTAFFTPNAYSPLLFTITAFAVIGLEELKRAANILPAAAPVPQPPVRHFRTTRMIAPRPAASRR